MKIFEPGRLLLVDTDSNECHRLKRDLESCGWRVWAATDASAAIQIISEHRLTIDAAIVDLQLPGLQAHRVMLELDSLETCPARLAMSARISPPAIDVYRKVSGATLLLKPVRREDVESALFECSRRPHAESYVTVGGEVSE